MHEMFVNPLNCLRLRTAATHVGWVISPIIYQFPLSEIYDQLPPRQNYRGDLLLHSSTCRPKVRPTDAEYRTPAKRLCGHKCRTAVSVRRHRRASRSFARGLDITRRGRGLLDPVAVDQVTLHASLRNNREAERVQSCETGTRRVAAQILGTPNKGRNGLRIACQILLVEPCEAWLCRAPCGLAILLNPPRYSRGKS